MATSCRESATDFNQAFVEGRTFRDDAPRTFTGSGWMPAQSTLYRTLVEPIGKLRLPTGSIVAADPSAIWADSVPLEHIVPPGAYPVDLCLIRDDPDSPAHGWRTGVAAIRVAFSDSTPISWPLALTIGHENHVVPLHQTFGFGIDAGMVSLCDSQVLKGIAARYDLGEEVAEAFYFDEVVGPFNARAGDHIDLTLDEATGANMIVVDSNGDGCCSSYWGIDDQGRVAALVLDLGLLHRDVYSERDLGLFVKNVGRTLEIDLPRGHLQLTIVQRSATISTTMQGPASSDSMVEFRHAGGPFHSARGTHSLGQVGQDFSKNSSTYDLPLPDDLRVVLHFRERLDSLFPNRNTQVGS